VTAAIGTKSRLFSFRLTLRVLQGALRLNGALSPWALALQQRRGYHRARIAIAAKNARIAWALLAKDTVIVAA
jgi:transposase